MAEALADPGVNFEILTSKLRQHAVIVQRKETSGLYIAEPTEESEAYFTDRKYIGRMNRTRRSPLC